MPPRDPSSVTLEQALAYQNDLIPRRFLVDWDLDLDEARLLFEDVKRYLWLNCQMNWELTFVGPMGILDEMLHTFILFTAEYTKYCDELYGEYVHHIPITADDRDQADAKAAVDPAGMLARELNDRDRMRKGIAEKLGIEVLIRWWVDYPIRFGDEFFRTKHKPHRTHWKPDAALVELAAQLRSA